MKILIVDDNAAIREIIRDILAGEGHTVRSSWTPGSVARTVSMSWRRWILRSPRRPCASSFSRDPGT